MQLKSPTTSIKSRNSYAAADDIIQNDLQQTTIPQIQTDFNLSEHQLKSREACLREFENLQSAAEDLQSIFYRLSETVVEQAEHVDQVADNVEETQEHVVQGERSLRQALTYKKAMYPVCGALIGTCLGGPVGLFAGMKIGGLAAVGCGILGFTGGAAIKSKEEHDLATIAQPIDEDEKKNE